MSERPPTGRLRPITGPRGLPIETPVAGPPALTGERALSVVRALTSLAATLKELRALDAILQRVVDTAALVLGTQRASIRLLDPDGKRLLTAVRAGSPVHGRGETEFVVGVGLVGWIAAQRQPLCSGDARTDARFAARAGMTEDIGSFVGVPLLSGNTCFGVLSANAAERHRYGADNQAILELLAAISAPHVELGRMSRQYVVDALTGVHNQRALDELVPFAPNPNVPLSVVAVDIDNFRALNDRHGHAVGDDLLKRVAQILSEVVKRGDAVMRSGSDDFLLALYYAGSATARAVAERARTTLEATLLDLGGTRVTVTLSAGVAERRHTEDRDSLLGRADAALQAAKNAGKNKTITAS